MEINYSEKSVLIVDHNLEDLGALRSVLSNLGIKKIQVASSVNMALNLMRFDHYDICLAAYDLAKHEKSGLQLLHEANAEGLRRAGDLFILIVDAERSSLLFGSLEHSPDTYISKPFDVARIRHRLEKISRVKQVIAPLEKRLSENQSEAFLSGCDQLISRFPGLQVFLSRQKGVVLLRCGRYREALALFSQLLKGRELPWAEVGLGMSQYHLGAYREALQTLGRVIDQQHICVEAFYWLGQAHRALGEMNQAVALMRKAVMLQPTVPSLQGELGDLAAQDAQVDIALGAYRQALRFARGTAFQRPGHYLGLVRVLAPRMKVSDKERAAEAEAEVVTVLESALLDHEGSLEVQLQVKLCAFEVYQEAGFLVRAEQIWRDVQAVFTQLDEEQQVSWFDQLLASGGVRYRSELMQQQPEMQKQMARYHWGKAAVAGSFNLSQGHYAKAFSLLRQAQQLQPAHLGIALDMVEAGIGYLKTEQENRRGVLLRSVKVLCEIRFGELAASQVARYKRQVESCVESLAGPDARNA
ncbi:tetratricopeptide repeat protein [Marinobacterium jannaschii]|uniref:tetratricopeptide repeat protein n=1 Tax=Marinobacterium jannaschii TaxID=64970 RepID=UPI00048A0849|nr:tetratricopeptide repeat protein [Marinobacterium jannaschii]